MKKQNLLVILLAFGLLFSTTLEFKFDFHNGFKITGLWINPTFQFLDFAGKSSNELFLTSQLVGNTSTSSLAFR